MLRDRMECLPAHPEKMGAFARIRVAVSSPVTAANLGVYPDGRTKYTL